MIFFPLSLKKRTSVKQNSNNYLNFIFIDSKNNRKPRFILLTYTNHNIIYKVDYSIYQKSNFTLITNNKLIQLKEIFNTKELILTKGFSSDQTFFYKNALLKEKWLHYIPSTTSFTYFTQTSFLTPKNVLFNKIDNLLIIYNCYLFWSEIFNNSIKSVFGYNKLNNIIQKEITGDITSGLLNIENILEVEISLSPYILNGVNIIIQTYVTYDYFLPYKKNQLILYSLDKNKTYLLSTHNQCSVIYETSSSIISPNINISDKQHSLNQILFTLYLQKLNSFTPSLACRLSFFFIFNAIVESLLKQYLLYGITIPSMHFELLTFKMTSFVKITYTANSTLLINDIIESSKAYILEDTLINLGYKSISYIPIILGITKSVFIHSNNLASLSFQAMFKYLTKLSLESTTDWLTDIKSNIITSRIIKSGSGWYRHYIKF